MQQPMAMHPHAMQAHAMQPQAMQPQAMQLQAMQPQAMQVHATPPQAMFQTPALQPQVMQSAYGFGPALAPQQGFMAASMPMHPFAGPAQYTQALLPQSKRSGAAMQAQGRGPHGHGPGAKLRQFPTIVQCVGQMSMTDKLTILARVAPSQWNEVSARHSTDHEVNAALAVGFDRWPGSPIEIRTACDQDQPSGLAVCTRV